MNTKYNRLHSKILLLYLLMIIFSGESVVYTADFYTHYTFCFYLTKEGEPIPQQEVKGITNLTTLINTNMKENKWKKIEKKGKQLKGSVYFFLWNTLTKDLFPGKTPIDFKVMGMDGKYVARRGWYKKKTNRPTSYSFLLIQQPFPTITVSCDIKVKEISKTIQQPIYEDTTLEDIFILCVDTVSAGHKHYYSDTCTLKYAGERPIPITEVDMNQKLLQSTDWARTKKITFQNTTSISFAELFTFTIKQKSNTDLLNTQKDEKSSVLNFFFGSRKKTACTTIVTTFLIVSMMGSFLFWRKKKQVYNSQDE